MNTETLNILVFDTCPAYGGGIYRFSMSDTDGFVSAFSLAKHRERVYNKSR